MSYLIILHYTLHISEIHMCNYLQNPRVINDERNKIASINTTKDDITSDDDSGIEEVEEWIDLKNVTRLENVNW